MLSNIVLPTLLARRAGGGLLAFFERKLVGLCCLVLLVFNAEVLFHENEYACILSFVFEELLVV